MAGKYDIKDVGVIYLDQIPQGSFPTEQPFTGILGWDGSNLVVKFDNQGPVYYTVPSYNITQKSLEVYDVNNGAVVIPTYSVATGEYLIRDSQGNDYTPRASVLSQNVAIIGTANGNLNNVCVGGVYLEAGTTIDGNFSTAYMSGAGTAGIAVLLLCGSNAAPPGFAPVIASWTLTSPFNPLNPTGRISVAMDSPTGTIPSSGWYDLILVMNINQQDPNASTSVFGLRLVVT
jgi:hypothetical protein